MNLHEDPHRMLIEMDTGKHVVSYVLIAAVEDLEGRQHLYQLTNERQTATVTIGLLEAVSAVEKMRIVHEWGADD
jgi:hypothetical protein